MGQSLLFGSLSSKKKLVGAEGETPSQSAALTAPPEGKARPASPFGRGGTAQAVTERVIVQDKRFDRGDCPCPCSVIYVTIHFINMNL